MQKLGLRGLRGGRLLLRRLLVQSGEPVFDDAEVAPDQLHLHDLPVAQGVALTGISESTLSAAFAGLPGL